MNLMKQLFTYKKLLSDIWAGDVSKQDPQPSN